MFAKKANSFLWENGRKLEYLRPATAYGRKRQAEAPAITKAVPSSPIWTFPA